MSDTPTYDQLSALCAQMAAALEATNKAVGLEANAAAYAARERALTAYRTLSPDPQWQRVPGSWPTREMEIAGYDVIERAKISLAGWDDLSPVEVFMAMWEKRNV